MSGPRLPSYAVISPVRDEAEFLSRTAECLIAQTHPPARWVIVDDGSIDDTRAIAQRYADAHDWISVIDSGATHLRARGGPIVRAFNRGLAELPSLPEIVVKLDGDVFLPAHYFEWVTETFARDPRAGIVSGQVLVFKGTRWSLDERIARNTTNGVAKSYRTACLKDIGGLCTSMGWDSLDEHGARARGWKVHVLTELQILHYKQRGSKQRWYRARWEEGVANHYMGYLPGFLLLRAAYRMLVEHPPIIGGAVLALGYAWSALRRAPRVDDPLAREEMRKEQWARIGRLLRGRLALDPSDLEGGGPALWSLSRRRK